MGRKKGVNISVEILGSTGVLFLGFGADPTALLDKLSALTLMKAHPVAFTARKSLFHLGRRFTSRQRSRLLSKKE